MVIVNGNEATLPGVETGIVAGRIFYGSYPFQPETEAIINRAEELEYTTPSFYQRVFMDLKIKAMKLAGVWDKLDAYYNFAYNKPLIDDNIKFNGTVWSIRRVERVWDNNIKNPFGNKGAMKIVPNEEGDLVHAMVSSVRQVMLSEGYCTVSCYVKPAEYNRYIRLANTKIFGGVLDIHYATFDMQEETAIDITPGTVATTIEKVLGGWFRVSVTAKCDADVSRTTIQIHDNNNNSVYAGDNVGGMYVWGVQIDNTITAQPFIPILDQFTLINWKDPEVIATVNGSMQYTAGGWLGNGLNGYLDTNYNPSVQGVNYTLNDASRLSVFYYDAGSSNSVNVIDGVLLNSILNSSRLQNGTQLYINQHDVNNNASQGVDFTGTGLKAINRTSENDLLLINKNTSVESTQPVSFIPNDNQYIFRRGGGGGASYGASGISMYGMGASLTYDQIQQLRTIENNWFKLNALPEIA